MVQIIRRKFKEATLLPLWVNGRALITTGTRLCNVYNKRGEISHKVPICDAQESKEIYDIARKALESWSILEPSKRIEPCAVCALWLQEPEYKTHFTQLISEEIRCYNTQTEAAHALKALADELRALPEDKLLLPENKQHKHLVQTLLLTPQATLAQFATWLKDTLLAGHVAVIFPPCESPSIVLALVELMSRAGLPAGVVNVLYIDEQEDMITQLVPQQDAAAIQKI